MGIALAGFALGLWRRALVWRRGATRRVAFLPSLVAIPGRYFVDLHHKVVRDRYSARMHVAVAGGFLTAMALLVATLIWPGQPYLHGAGLVAAVVMLLGGLAAALRRRHSAGYPASPSGGEWKRLALSASAGALGLILWFASVGHSFIGAGLIGLMLLDLVLGASWGTAMRHALNGALNLGFHPRPDRFKDRRGRDTGLHPLDLSAPRLGIATAQDLDWTRRLNLDACVQCGRCEAACPAFAAGQPLNPKALVQDLLVAGGMARMAGVYHGNGHPHMPIQTTAQAGASLVPDLLSPDTIWSCTTCRACVEECPMMIEHVDAVIDLRRHEVLEKAAVPGKGVDVLTRYAATDTPSGRDPARRFDWAAGLGLAQLSETGEAELLLWVGEAGFDARGQRTLTAFANLLKAAGVSAAVLGPEERDSGDLARRLGDEATFQRIARANIKTLSRYRIGRIVTTDPHVLHVLREEYPSFGAVPEILHHSEMIAELLSRGALKVPKAALRRRITYHDPCYLGRYSGQYEAPRRALSAVAEIAEMNRSRHRSRCCGGGGGAPVADIPGDRRIADMRMQDVADSGRQTVAVACPNCAIMLEGASGHSADVRDIAEIVADAVLGEVA